VVPRDGVWSANGHASFPIDRPLLFNPTDGVWHTRFFARPETVAHIDRHLGIAAAPALVTGPSAVRGGLRGGTRGPSRAGGTPSVAASVTVERQPRIEFREQVIEG